ncbi:MAG: hypothetical protein ACFFCZ_24015 [Promethearchaeota archaeon]
MHKLKRPIENQTSISNNRMLKSSNIKTKSGYPSFWLGNETNYTPIRKKTEIFSFSDFLKDRWIEKIKKGEMIEGKIIDGAVVKVLFNHSYPSYIYFPEWQQYDIQTIKTNKAGVFKHIGNGLFYNKSL